MKRCGKCGETKKLTEFNRRGESGYQHWCKSCKKVTKRAWLDDNLERVLKAQLDRRWANADLVNDYLATHPCVDCGESDIVVLEFDHRDQSLKLWNISTMVSTGFSWEKILEEIKKCDVRCANDHRRRTAVQLGWRKKYGALE